MAYLWPTRSLRASQLKAASPGKQKPRRIPNCAARVPRFSASAQATPVDE